MNYYLNTRTDRRLPTHTPYLLCQLQSSHIRDQLHRFQLACRVRTLRVYAQRLLPSPHRILLSPHPLRLLSASGPERSRHRTLGDYSRKSSLYGARCGNFVRRDLNPRQVIPWGMRSLVHRSLHIGLRDQLRYIIIHNYFINVFIFNTLSKNTTYPYYLSTATY